MSYIGTPVLSARAKSEEQIALSSPFVQRSTKTQPVVAIFSSKVLLVCQQQTSFLMELMSEKDLVKNLINCQRKI